MIGTGSAISHARAGDSCLESCLHDLMYTIGGKSFLSGGEGGMRDSISQRGMLIASQWLFDVVSGDSNYPHAWASSHLWSVLDPSRQ